jgi:hypothetical protein
MATEIIEASKDDSDLHEMIARFREALCVAGYDHKQIGYLMLTQAGAVLCHAEGRVEAVKTLRGLADELEKGFATLS